ncbi:hypothetical protein JMJ35_004167 [Cladonia borealis]|uniref:Uncharacterized protein n=1 Tax=Cladonia borealis TaxID=184061 RepID=A0AA39R355_9LECA|nr:hypothetical protein JMJ35_004167 [Cladonia borealis]
MSELPYYAPGESGLYGDRLSDPIKGDSVSADRQLSSKSADTIVPQSIAEAHSLAGSGSPSPRGNSNGAKTETPRLDKADPLPPTPVASENTFYPGCIHIKADPNTIALWHPDTRKREPISVVTKAKTFQPTTPGSQVQGYHGYYQQLGCIPIAYETTPNTTLCWDINSPEGEYLNLTSTAKDGPPTSSRENQPFSFSPSISPTTSNTRASTSPICRSCSSAPTSPKSPISSRRTRLRAQLASARQRRKSLDCDIARLSTALEMEEPHECGQWAALQGHLKCQLQVAERQREELVARGEKTEELDIEIEGLRGTLGETYGGGGDGKRKRMNEGILMGRIVKREVIGGPEREG